MKALGAPLSVFFWNFWLIAVITWGAGAANEGRPIMAPCAVVTAARRIRPQNLSRNMRMDSTLPSDRLSSLLWVRR